MSESCEQLDAYFDGELDTRDHEEFDVHLASCKNCQSGLEELIQISLLADDMAGQESSRPVISISRRRRRIPVIAAVVVAAAAAGWLLLAGAPGRDEPEQMALALAPQRTIEVRFAHPAAREHRPYDPQRAHAAPTQEQIPLSLLARLEEKRDFHGLAVALALSGRFDDAVASIDRAENSSDVLADRAAALIARRELGQALDVLDRILDQEPEHAVASWNRALVLRDLGLPLAAANSFARVAKLDEPGWSEEATERAAALGREVAARKDAYFEAWQAGKAMFEGGPPLSAEQALQQPGLSRLFFYDAVRAAPSPERIRELMPLARALDQHYGGQYLVEYGDKALGMDWSVRRPLAEKYRVLAHSSSLPPAEEIDSYLANLETAGQHDILLGAILHAWRVEARLQQFQQLADMSGDPWFVALAAEQRAFALRASSDTGEEERTLLAGIEVCTRAAMPARCARLENQLANLYVLLRRMPEAFAVLDRGWQRARSHRLWGLETGFLETMMQAARFRHDLGLLRAYAEEYSLRFAGEPALHCRQERYAYTTLAGAYAPRAAEMRRFLELVPRCGDEPPTLLELVTRTYLARIEGKPEQIQTILEELARARATELSPEQRAYADYVEGAALLELAGRQEQGRELLRRAIDQANELLARDQQAEVTRSTSYAMLVLDAGRRGRYEQVFELVAQELGIEPPAACALGIAVHHESTTVAVREPDGELRGWFDNHRDSLAIEPEKLVPAELAALLSKCELVDVLARPPLIGMTGFLGPEVAWRYRIAAGKDVASQAVSRRRLVVANIEAPASLGLPRLTPWKDLGRIAGESVQPLLGPEATPSAVRQAMQQATVIEIHAHGLVEAEVSDATSLVLSPGTDEHWALTARDIKNTALEGRPLVILGACRAAEVAPYNHKAWGLPTAFLEAGATTVIASPSPIRDIDAEEFFAALRDRVTRGQPAAMAVRDLRLGAKDSQGWQSQVVVIE